MHAAVDGSDDYPLLLEEVLAVLTKGYGMHHRGFLGIAIVSDH